MALPRSLRQFTSELPYVLRLDVEGYVRTIDAARGEIYREARVNADEVRSDDFLFCAGLWRLWSQVESQRWLIKNSLDLAGEFGAQEISAGGYSYRRGSDEVRQARELHDDLDRWLESKELGFVKLANGPRSLLEHLADRRTNDS
ncbi:MAG: hypothetical protein WBF71_05070 [Microthrixaceae bacterium]